MRPPVPVPLHVLGRVRRPVTDGLARDSAGIAEVGLPVFASGISPNSAARSGPGTIGLPITVSGVRIEPGDIVVGDPDGGGGRTRSQHRCRIHPTRGGARRGGFLPHRSERRSPRTRVRAHPPVLRISSMPRLTPPPNLGGPTTRAERDHHSGGQEHHCAPRHRELLPNVKRSSDVFRSGTGLHACPRTCRSRAAVSNRTLRLPSTNAGGRLPDPCTTVRPRSRPERSVGDLLRREWVLAVVLEGVTLTV